MRRHRRRSSIVAQLDRPVSWFHEGISKEDALHLLRPAPPQAFLVASLVGAPDALFLAVKREVGAGEAGEDVLLLDIGREEDDLVVCIGDDTFVSSSLTGLVAKAAPAGVTLPMPSPEFQAASLAAVGSGGVAAADRYETSVLGFGSGQHGVLGVGIDACMVFAQVVSSQWFGFASRGQRRRVVRIATGANHSVAATATGATFVWGLNTSGQLGLGFRKGHRDRPCEVPALLARRVVAVAAGEAHTLAVSDTGNVFAWGYGAYGQLGQGSQTNFSAPVGVVAFESFPPLGPALQPELVPTRTGTRRMKTLVTDARVVDVAAGGNSSFAVVASGKVYGWGENSSGQLGLGDVKVNVTTPQGVEELRQHVVVAVGTGARHTVFLTEAGWVFVAGSGRFGRLGTGDDRDRANPVRIKPHPPGERVVRLSVGTSHSLVCTDAGRVYSWGGADHGQLGHEAVPDPEVATGVIAGTHLPRLVAGLEEHTIVDVGAAETHSLAISSSGELYSWGGNSQYQCGVGHNNQVDLPTQVPRVGGLFSRHAVACAPGMDHTLVLVVQDTHEPTPGSTLTAVREPFRRESATTAGSTSPTDHFDLSLQHGDSLGPTHSPVSPTLAALDVSVRALTPRSKYVVKRRQAQKLRRWSSVHADPPPPRPAHLRTLTGNETSLAAAAAAASTEFLVGAAAGSSASPAPTPTPTSTPQAGRTPQPSPQPSGSPMGKPPPLPLLLSPTPVLASPGPPSAKSLVVVTGGESPAVTTAVAALANGDNDEHALTPVTRHRTVSDVTRQESCRLHAVLTPVEPLSVSSVVSATTVMAAMPTTDAVVPTGRAAQPAGAAVVTPSTVGGMQSLEVAAGPTPRVVQPSACSRALACLTCGLLGTPANPQQDFDGVAGVEWDGRNARS